MTQVFLGSEAIASGRLTKYDLRARCRRVLPGVYAPKGPLTLTDRIVATWLWSHRQGVICGLAASAVHGAKWVDADADIEINWHHRKPPPGVVTRSGSLSGDEIDLSKRVAVTNVERTAFDLARQGSVSMAVQRLDALAAATEFKVDGVLAVAANHPHVRRLLRVPDVLDRLDAGAQSPRETWLRMLLTDAGFPRPETQIPVLGPDGYPRYFLDMGWREVMVAAEYDGEQHRIERDVYRNDLRRSEYIAEVGWRRIRVIAGDGRAEIVRRVERAWEAAQKAARTSR
ncbi:MAG TPA: hypothetical protein VFW21_04540 [Mycobacterium sp.]|nr:hypothetical protein [Mycobacterium sp.]